MDRFDLRVEVPPVTVEDLALPRPGEASAGDRRAGGARARAIQRARFAGHDGRRGERRRRGRPARSDRRAHRRRGEAASPRSPQRFRLSARAYHRVLRVARTIADLEGSEPVEKPHVAEAAGYRIAVLRRPPSGVGDG